jgi:hypothetical protein
MSKVQKQTHRETSSSGVLSVPAKDLKRPQIRMPKRKNKPPRGIAERRPERLREGPRMATSPNIKIAKTNPL